MSTAMSTAKSGALVGLGDTSPSSAVGLRLRRELIATPASSSHGRALLDFADFS